MKRINASRAECVQKRTSKRRNWNAKVLGTMAGAFVGVASVLGAGSLLSGAVKGLGAGAVNGAGMGIVAGVVRSDEVAAEASVEKIDLTEQGSTTVTIAKATYTGTQCTPKVTVVSHGKTLVQNTDYTLWYFDNTKAGEASIKIQGKGNYFGLVTKTFKIEPYSFAGKLQISDIPDVTFDGTEMKPMVTVYLDGEKLKFGSDYTLTYSDNVSVGKGKVTVTGINNYKGTQTKTFTIQAPDAPDAPTKTTALSTAYNSVTLIWEGVTGVNGYQVMYSTSPNGTYTSLGTLSGTQKAVYNLQTGTKYYFKVRSYVKLSDGSMLFGSYSDVFVGVPMVTPPTNVETTQIDPTRVGISWKPTMGLTYVEVWRTHKAQAEQKDYVLIGIYNAGDEGCISKYLTPNKTYYYKLRGYRVREDGKKIYSHYSQVVSATPSVRLGAPKNPRIIKCTTTTITLAWNPVPGANIMYEVWRLSSKDNTPGVCLGRYNNIEKVSTNLKPSTTYYYRIRCYYYYYDAAGQIHRVYSPYGKTISASTLS
ncbi:MAG: fibronectin type III domain-containing protein [Clostridiales bacterium]|nr:fibronectin type III domain-containing protein [Clostridiales bacterium]